MNETPKQSIGGALKETVSGRIPVPEAPQPGKRLLFYNPSRVAIVQALLNEPALSASRVAHQSGMDHSSTMWHLRQLETADVVVRLRDEGWAYFTPKRLVPYAEALYDLRTCYCKGCTELLSLAASSPGIDIVRAAESLKTTRGSVARTLAKLSSRRLMTARRDGPRRRLFLTDRIAELSDNSRKWYKDYRPMLLSLLSSEGLDVRTDASQDRSLRLEFKVGERVAVLVLPYRLTIVKS